MGYNDKSLPCARELGLLTQALGYGREPRVFISTVKANCALIRELLRLATEANPEDSSRPRPAHTSKGKV